MREERHLFLLLLLIVSPLAPDAHECPVEVLEEVDPGEDWLEGEVVAGFRIWQILFLVVAGMGTLVVVCCCVTRCRIPRTRQEIEANHRRNLITQLFRQHLDAMVVDEVDLLWALDEVKAAAKIPALTPQPRPTLVERMKALVLTRRKKSSEGEETDQLEPEERPDANISFDTTDGEDSPH